MYIILEFWYDVLASTFAPDCGWKLVGFTASELEAQLIIKNSPLISNLKVPRFIVDRYGNRKQYRVIKLRKDFRQTDSSDLLFAMTIELPNSLIEEEVGEEN